MTEKDRVSAENGYPVLAIYEGMLDVMRNRKNDIKKDWDITVYRHKREDARQGDTAGHYYEKVYQKLEIGVLIR